MNEQLKIIISAEIDNLKSEVKKAKKEIEYFKNDATININKFNKAFNNAMKDLSTEGNAEFKKINSVFQAEMTKMAQKGKIKSGDLEKAFDKACDGISDDAKKAFKQLYNEAKKNTDKTSRELKTTFEKVGSSMKTGLAIGIGAIAAVGGALISTSKSTEEYRINQAKLNAAFEAAELSAGSAKDIYKNLFAVLGESDQAVESANNIALFAKSEEEAAKWAELASGVVGTFHDTLQPEAFYEAANETLKLGEATGGYAQMLEQTGIMSVDEFNKKLAACNTEAEKQELALQVAEDALGEAGEAYDKNTEKIQKQREAQAELDDTMAKLGDAMTPVVTAFTNFANEIMERVTPAIEDFMDNHGEELKTTLEDIATAVGDVITWIVDNWETVAAVAGVVTGIAVAIGAVSTALNIYNAVVAITNVVSLPTIGIFLAIVTAIGAIIAIIVVCVKNWDTIKAKIKEVAEKIKTWIKDMKDKVVKWFNDMKEKVVNKVTELKDKAVDKFNEIKEGIKNKIEEAKKKVVDKFTEIKENITSKITEAKTNVIDKFTEIKTGITDKIEEVKTNVKNKFDEVKEKITQPIEDAKESVKGIVDDIKDFFDFDWSLPKLKMPHFSIDGKFSLNPPSVPKFNISWYAQGGIFDKPTLFPYGNGAIGGLGEAGAEAIVPLEKNTQWLDKIAEKLAAKQGNQPIVLQVDGKTFAQISVDSINDLTRVRGSLPLKLV